MNRLTPPLFLGALILLGTVSCSNPCEKLLNLTCACSGNYARTKCQEAKKEFHKTPRRYQSDQCQKLIPKFKCPKKP